MICLQKMLQNVSSLCVNMEKSNTAFDSKQYLVCSIEIVKEIQQISWEAIQLF